MLIKEGDNIIEYKAVETHHIPTVTADRAVYEELLGLSDEAQAKIIHLVNSYGTDWPEKVEDMVGKLNDILSVKEDG